LLEMLLKRELPPDENPAGVPIFLHLLISRQAFPTAFNAKA
jgi:hypothetical protein